MNYSCTHDLQEESIESKTKWFKSLTISERMEMLCSFTEMLLSVNPKLADNSKNVKSFKGRIQIISEA